MPLIAKSVVLNVLNPVFVAKLTDAAKARVGVSRQAVRATSRGDDAFVVMGRDLVHPEKLRNTDTLDPPDLIAQSGNVRSNYEKYAYFTAAPAISPGVVILEHAQGLVAEPGTANTIVRLCTDAICSPHAAGKQRVIRPSSPGRHG